MILPDVNLLVYAHNEASRYFKGSKSWWEDCLNGDAPILLPSICVSGFVRIMTHPKILQEPLEVEEAFEMTDVWMQSPNISLLSPGISHYPLFKRTLSNVGIGGKLTTDAYIAAMAMENQATLFSSDQDFSRFPGLKWVNPLA